MTKIFGLSGSLRENSYNTALLRAAATVAPKGVEVDISTIRGVPLYDGDLEVSEGVPAEVESLKERLVSANGLLLVTPEYNNGIPGAFKNAIDWMSRPPADISKVFKGRPVAIMGASPGGFGTILAQNHWLPVLRTLGMRPWFEGRLMVSRAGSVFDEEGNLTDDALRERLQDFVAGFASFVQGHDRTT
ncbi:NADPH-dependent FMN reductase [Fodinicurvata sediminis]|uniref:NADPH-dependent FMN reductase n=1 Tax=Fodinicurvata sediminis TaxID=1121832 RepID=UPI0003B3318E|nr:NADPH-dependent FMN reductase [Fodinicurvata sediminis]